MKVIPMIMLSYKMNALNTQSIFLHIFEK